MAQLIAVVNRDKVACSLQQPSTPSPQISPTSYLVIFEARSKQSCGLGLLKFGGMIASQSPHATSSQLHSKRRVRQLRRRETMQVNLTDSRREGMTITFE